MALFKTPLISRVTGNILVQGYYRGISNFAKMTTFWPIFGIFSDYFGPRHGTISMNSGKKGVFDTNPKLAIFGKNGKITTLLELKNRQNDHFLTTFLALFPLFEKLVITFSKVGHKSDQN